MNRVLSCLILVAGFSVALLAQDQKQTIEKDITIIHGQSIADGKSEIGERILEECIVALPQVDDLIPEISSESHFLKEINGDPAKNDHVKTYTASVEINYMIYQKVLVIVATSSIKGQEPVMKVMEKSLKQSKRFVSNPSEGDLYAGRSRRQYYFSTREGAANDVKKRAAIWLKQQAAVTCKK